MKILKNAYHRNGIAGDGFNVTLFEDDDKTTKVAIDFGKGKMAILQVDLLAEGAIDASEGNQWRFEWYVDKIRDLRKEWKAEHGEPV